MKCARTFFYTIGVLIIITKMNCTFHLVCFSGFCAVLDEDTYNLNYIKCVAASGCPATAYSAAEVYRCKSQSSKK